MVDFSTPGLIFLILFVTVLTLTLVASGIALLVLASMRRPAQLRCRNCDYVLTGLKRTTGPCPECGSEFDLSEQARSFRGETRCNRALAGSGCLLVALAAILVLFTVNWFTTRFVGP